MANRTVSRAVRFALLAAAATAAVGSAPSVMAQEEELEQVVVTGSRIRRAVESETTQPVSVISRADIENQGFPEISDILQNSPVAGQPPISRAAPLSSGENSGGTFISLRNLGAQRNLVLLNGRRMPVTTSGLADVSLVPSIAVERIEVQKDGASAIYGSDAITGVINIITRGNYDGTTAGVYYGQYDDNDGEQTRAEFMTGLTGDKGWLTVSAEWADEEGVWAKDRWFSAYGRTDRHPTDGWTTVGQYGGFVTTASTAIPGVATGSRVIWGGSGDPRLAANWRAQNTNTGSCAVSAGATPAGGCVPGSVADKSNPNEQMHVETPLSRRALNVDGNYELASWVDLRTNFLYSQRTSERQIAGYPVQGSAIGVPMAATSYFNPTGATISNWWRRGWEVPRVTDSDLTTYNFSASLVGDFEVGANRFDWDFNYQHALTKNLQSTYGNFNIPRIASAIGPSFLNSQGQVQCGTPSAPIAFTTCVPWNPFLSYGKAGPGSLDSKALRDFLFQEEHNRGETTTTVWSANITGNIVPLPAGDLAFALGWENRKETGEFVPDSLAVTGASTNLSAGPTRGRYEVEEFYVELQVPVFKDLFLAKDLSLNLATRYSDYDSFGDTTNSKIGVKWQPIEQLMFRGTWAEGFRAPTIADLYGGGSQTFAFFTDPCDTVFGTSATSAAVRANCVAAMGPLANTFRQLGQGFNPVGAPNSQTPVAFISGSNPTLTPETSVTKTAGFVWSPPYVNGFNMAFDWWKIRIEDTIVADTPTTILDDCYVQGISSRCSPLLFTRDPSLGYVNYMQYGSRNAGYTEVEGYDLDLSYRFDLGSFGAFTLNSNTTYLDNYVTISTNDPRVPISSVGTGANFRTRSNFNVGWSLADFGASWTIRYFSGMEESCTYYVNDPATTTGSTLAGTIPNNECSRTEVRATGAYTASGDPARALQRIREVGSVAFNDVQVRWNAPWDGTIAVGANNVFDKEGPQMYSQPSANFAYYGGYDIGRFLYAKYTQKF